MREEMEKVCAQVKKVIVGKDDVVSRVLMTVLAGGHILLDDVPGVGKTTLCLALSRATGLAFRRIQFTPDVLPSDITGFTLYDRESGQFVYRPGIVTQANLLLGDEINRTSSRTQSALLETMEEKQVTVDGTTYPLKTPFLVIATQNHVGSAGTQPLPFTQLDRFMTCLTLGYPDREAQIRLLRERQADNPLDTVEPVIDAETVCQLQARVRQVHVSDLIYDYITSLAIASREHEKLENGISPRGTLMLSRMAAASAFADDRDFVTAWDVQSVFLDTCAHRVLLSRRARQEGTTSAEVLCDILHAVPVPDGGAQG
ncbi:MAG: MoxR family ATPase [Clostridia bacterium]|nr:MoxR family ATPase [Clostridia bacterium]MBR1685073.1 MoxR family ATPase [Clostridia bacterium]